MDINLLSKMIRELTLDNDCITLPGLGSFVATEMPASFSDRGFTINPPYRRLSFTTEQGSDTLLPDMYAANNSIDGDQSRVIIKRFISELKEQLRSNGFVDFPELGRLKSTRDDSLLFICDPDLDIFSQGLGLEPISLRFKFSVPEESKSQPESQSEPQLQPIPEQQPEPQPEPESNPEPERQRKKSPVGKIILTILIILAIAAGLFFYAVIYQPDLLDKLLYTPEELDIINTVL